MDGIFDAGPITEALRNLDPRYRPMIEAALVAVISLYLMALIANPIFEFFHRLLRLAAWLGRQLNGL
ncbi:MAG: hypothetical protein HXY28_03380 [Hydrogenophilaceae bacterium]|jgi:hypothetical protein|nr:hypothetical protein [Hydrogenophilaceae bacterium]